MLTVPEVRSFPGVNVLTSKAPKSVRGWCYQPGVSDPDEEADLEDIYPTLTGRWGSHPRRATRTPRRRWPHDAEIFAGARRFHRTLRARLNESLGDVGLNYAKLEVLEALAAIATSTRPAIAYHRRISRQAVNRLVRTLRREGYVEALRIDEGVLALRLTEAGRDLLASEFSAGVTKSASLPGDWPANRYRVPREPAESQLPR